MKPTNKKNEFFKVLSIILLVFLFPGCQDKSTRDTGDNAIIENKWTPLRTINEDGLMGERADAWRNNRLWYMAESGYLIDGFENRPGEHPWQGEHLGKWLHAASLAYHVNGDEELRMQMQCLVERLLATQLPNGYMGTYADDITFMAKPEGFDPNSFADDTYTAEEREAAIKSWRRGGWDTWTFRYNIYGLLTYEKYFPDERIVQACEKMADLLIETYGEGKSDLTKYGTRQGISATTLLESIVMLYERTGDVKYLNFAEHIVTMSENNPKLRLMDAMLKSESVVYSGDGKAYQLMANLLGYLRLYKCTGKEKYLQTVLNGWKEIHDKHILVTGGPWTRHLPYNGNRECFANTEDFNPVEISVENCCTVTWMQLNIHLFELTGLAKYFDQAEITLLNDLYEHQHTDGIDWCYYTAPNEPIPRYESRFSSGPRGLEIFSNNLAGKIDNHISVNSLAPATIELTSQFGGGTLKIESNFPTTSSAEIYIEAQRSKKYTLEFKLPYGSSLNHTKINGETAEVIENSRGFFELTRKWKEGDVLSIDMKYNLELHVQEGEEGQKWIAFTYGPIALAQKITGLPGEEPFSDLNINLDEPERILSMLTRSETDDSQTIFIVKDYGITLIPYYLTGTRESGPRTYFKYSYNSL